ncbi:hypothetical protein K7X08_016158 [Anisodus acutangulus]|uniref:Uncharacterized protein n=1 Tax=Anisodus acutangulus TaxID=402998 RepID=A0A9Q1LGS1_9SOLA|nr:hypothetical protein K7X08_016158 [Anisodus acutangulus]
MEMIKISQVLKLLLIASLLIVTPLLSTSLRTTYLYFIVHLLIISLGAEAGLISSSKSPNDKKLPSTNIIIPTKQHNMTTPMIVFSLLELVSIKKLPLKLNMII